MRRRSRSAGGPPDAASPQPPPVCPLCHRPIVPGPSADEHHLVPRSRGGRDKTLMHRICHRKLHAHFSVKELAERLNTWEALRAEPDIAAFVRWLERKPPDFYDASRKPKQRR